MRSNNTPKDKLPETFTSYEEAGDFWDTHDSTDYLEYLIPVQLESPDTPSVYSGPPLSLEDMEKAISVEAGKQRRNF
jgi:hypothetical protein